MRAKKLTSLALFSALSLAIYAAESAIPPLIPIPGIKLGLANIITLILLREAGTRDALLVLVARILLSTLLFGSLFSLFYSLPGGLCSLLFMALSVKLLGDKLTFLTGAVGGLTHNISQLLTAYLVTSSPGVFVYLPHLILGGILTGLFTGLCADFACRGLLSRTQLFRNS